MAATETKFRLSWIVLSVVFILLSESVAEDPESHTDVHRCYWCGPLAEQVHRSQRTSSCDGEKSKVTVCDKDLPYCAIVASSPPYQESRFCVKFYQDECYSLYCNSTKTWRITCPCKGELCNGAETKRELDAFKALIFNDVSKLTIKKRQKRVLTSKAGFIGLTTRRNKIDNTTEENKTTIIAPDSTSTVETVPTSESSHVVEVTSNENVPTTSEAKSGEDIEAKDTMTTSLESKTIDTNQITEPNIQIDMPNAKLDSGDLKTEIIVMSSELPKVAEGTKISEILTTSETKPTTEEIKITTEEIKITTETTTLMVKTSQAEVNSDKTKLKSNEKLPAAEALQHTDTPTTKTTEQMLTSTTTKSNRIDAATPATMSRNNTAVQISANIITLAIGVVLYY